MEVAEGNVNGDEDNIGWVAEEVAPKFDSLAKHKGPCRQCDHERLPVIGRPLLSCFEPRVEDEKIVWESPCGHRRLEDGIRAPWLGPILESIAGRLSIQTVCKLTTSSVAQRTSW